MVRLRKLERTLASLGNLTCTKYVCVINNDEPLEFDSYEACLTFIKDYRKGNSIFALNCFRINCYNLIEF